VKKDLEQFLEKMKHDKALQEKLEEKIKAYSGEKAEKAVFDSLLVPMAKEQGCDIAFEDLEALRAEMDVSADELAQTAGGDNKSAIDALACSGVGIGFGAGKNWTTGKKEFCFVIGAASGSTFCTGIGT